MDDRPEEALPESRPNPPDLSDSPLTRRALFGTVFGGVGVVAGLKTFEDRISPPDQSNKARSLAQFADATPRSVASPMASPLASPVASPAATPAGPEMVGNLLVRRGETFDYTTSPVSSDTLTLFVVGDGEQPNLSPAAFRHDFQISASYLDPLLWIDDLTLEPRPWLAERWEWDDSG
ncbi:MAG: hypothetical protein AB7V46_14610, partial [Thermomicrobiales bacterium]